MENDAMRIYVKLERVSYNGISSVNIYDVKSDRDIKTTFDKLIHIFRKDRYVDVIPYDSPTWYILIFDDNHEFSMIEASAVPTHVDGKLLEQMKVCSDNLNNIANYLMNRYREDQYDTRVLKMDMLNARLNVLSRYLSEIDYRSDTESHFMDIESMMGIYDMDYIEKMFYDYCDILIYFVRMKLNNNEFFRYGMDMHLYKCVTASVQELDRVLIL